MGYGTSIEVEEGDARPVVVKTATTEAGRALLAQEAQRLTRASHPGVVELLDHDGDRLVLAWAGGRTVALARPPVTVAAAILAAVASTIADLHELGIIHGRLDSSHVLVGIDGRPRLCGLCGPVSGGSEPTPADDVAAIGELMDELVGPEAEVEPIPDRRWGRRRWSGYQRRALQTLADQAGHEDPARRPTARSLAAAIAGAIPEARIEPADPHTADWIGTWPRQPSMTLRNEPTGTNGSASRADEAIPPMSPRPVPFEVVDHPEPGLHRESGGRVSPAGSTDAGPTEGCRPAAPVAEELPTDGTPSTPLPIEMGVAPRSDPSDAPGAPEPATADPTPLRSSTGELGRPDTILGLRVGRSVDQELAPPLRTGGRKPIDEGSGDRQDAPRHAADRGRRAQPSGGRRRRVGAPMLAGAAALLVLVAIVGWLRSTTGQPAPSAPGAVSADRGATKAPDPSPGAKPTTANSSTSPPPVEAAPTTLAGAACGAMTDGAPDVDGDGCPDDIVVTGTSIRAAGATYSVGQEGDQVAVQDWDCDGTATPGIVRPSTGEIFLFDGWATSDRALTIEADAVVTGAQRLAASPTADPCLGATVVLDDQTTRTIETLRSPP